MEEKTKQEIIRLEIEKCDRFLNQATNMLEQGIWDVAANRFYYACFHAVQALFINDGLNSHTHRGLHRVLGQNYVLTGKLSPELSGFMRTMEQIREKADYNCYYDVTEEEAREMQEPSKKIIEAIKELIR